MRAHVCRRVGSAALLSCFVGFAPRQAIAQANSAAQLQVTAVEEQLAATYSWLVWYRFALSVSAQPIGREELARRAAAYFSDGARVFGVPTSGPGAAYFQNGASLSTAPSNIVTETDPSEGAGSFDDARTGATAAPTPP